MIHQITIPTPFAIGDVNAFLVKGDALTLVDAGPKTPEAYEALKYGLKEVGYTFKDVEQVLLTHHHPDHSGWVDAFDNAELLGHSYNDFWLKREQAFLTYHDEFYLQQLVKEGVPEQYHKWLTQLKKSAILMGTRPLDKVIKEGDEIPGHFGWQALETLGHAQSHLVFWHEKEREMIGGDLLLNKVSSNPVIEPPQKQGEDRPKSLLQYKASLTRLLTMPIETIYGGHGDPVKNIHSLIEARQLEQHERAMQVYEMLEKGSRTTFELTKTLFPTLYEKELGLTLSETIGQVDYLISKEMISKTRTENGVSLYEQQ